MIEVLIGYIGYYDKLIEMECPRDSFEEMHKIIIAQRRATIVILEQMKEDLEILLKK